MKILKFGLFDILFLIGFFLYRILLDWCYFNIISPIFSYSGFHDNSSWEKFILSWLLLFLFFISSWYIYSQENWRASTMVTFVLGIISFVPFTTCVHAGILSKDLIFYFCLYWLLLLILQKILLHIPIQRFAKLCIFDFAIDDKFIKIVGSLSLLLVIAISFFYTGFRMHFNLYDVYGLRLEARNFNMPTILNYLFAWTRAVNPILLAYCLVKKKYAIGFLIFFTQMLSFGIDGMKTTFFMPFVILITIIIFDEKFSFIKIKNLIVWGLVILTSVSIAEYLATGSYTLASLFIRRLLFVPRYLDTCYYDFFLTNEPDFFRSSFLRHFGFISPYTGSDNGIPFIIGAQYFGNPNMNCNNGFFSDAISNFGSYGVLIMPFFLIFFLYLFDKSVLYLNRKLIIVPIFLFILGINSTFLLTELLTHGMLILMFLFSLMKPDHN